MEIKTTSLKTLNTDQRQVRPVGAATGMPVVQPTRGAGTEDRQTALDGAPPVAPVVAHQGAKPGQHQGSDASFTDFLMVDGQDAPIASQPKRAGTMPHLPNDTFTANLEPVATGYQASGKPGGTLSEQKVTGLVMDFKV